MKTYSGLQIIVLSMATALATTLLIILTLDRLKISTLGSIDAKEVRILDSAGNPRIVLGTTIGGSSFIKFFSESRHMSSGFQEINGIPELILFDHAGTPRLTARLEGDKPSIALTDKSGAVRMGLLVEDSDSPTLQFFDAEGVARIQLVEQGSVAQFLIRRPDGTKSILLSQEDPDGLIALYGHGEEPAITILEHEAMGNLMLYNEKGESRIDLTVSDERAVLSFWDEAGLPRRIIGIRANGTIMDYTDPGTK